MTTFDLAITYLKKIDFNNFSESEEGLSIKKPSRALKNELDKLSLPLKTTVPIQEAVNTIPRFVL